MTRLLLVSFFVVGFLVSEEVGMMGRMWFDDVDSCDFCGFERAFFFVDEVDRELERRVECLEEEGRRLQREVENKRENALGLIEKRLQKIAAETSEKMKENAVQNVSVEDKGVGYSVEDVLGKELAERMRNRKEKALEMLKRLVVQGSDLKKRVGHVDKVLKMIKDCEPKSSLGELVNADDGVNKDEDNLTIDLTDITGTVIQSNRGRRSRMSLLTTPL